ncbi:hypothetical protein M885DRAFT_508368 [Pelagophyceae sp. CCMP2097]|nr:hypothetical protein M885DRAFT_508368 [Pelagophyceae sp. CCMP2097]|mmetsp:Transcript_23592/g.80580  ORF Transcript_23592/g.80580 Transcript_23592/m.80580 type:complete len:351 (-) Transcript_23592:82-1134(-)
MEVRGAPAGASGGCCADTLRVYGAAGANDVNLDALLDGIFAEDAPWHHATHTFDVYLLDGRPHAMLQVQYSDARLDGTKVNALVVVNVESNMVVPTVDGDLYFSISDHLGTRSLVYRETVYKVQYFNASTEEWHGNGVLRFEAADGTRLVALTHRFYQEAFVIKDPWAYGAADGGGGEMLQRFGTAPFYNAADNETAARRFHRFGLPASAAQFTGGVHNVFYTRNSTTAALRGRETLTLFVNSIQGLASSWVYELALRLSPEAALACPPSDAAFDTDFVAVRCGFEAQAMGGARVIANGVYLAASGAASTAAVSGVFELLDLQGGRIDLQYPGALGRRTSLYDTFATVVD